MSDKEIEKLVKEWEDLIGKFYVLGYHKFSKALKDSIAYVLLSLEQTGSLAVVSGLSDTLITDVAIANAMKQFIPKISDRTAKFFYSKYVSYLPTNARVEVGFGNELFKRVMNEYLVTEGAEHVKEITNTTRKLVNKALADSIENKETIKQAAKRINNYTLGGLDGRINRRARALLIARTETLMATGKAQYTQMLGFDIEVEKRWIHDHPKVPRDSHVQVANETKKKPIGRDDYFLVGGKKMRYAGDRLGGIENIANCRCSTVYLPKED